MFKRYWKDFAIFWGLFIVFVAGVFFFFYLVSAGKLGFMPTFEELENPKNKYPYHQQDILVSGSYGKLVNTLIELQSFGDSDCIAGGDQKGHCNRHFIKVVDQDRCYQIEA